MLEATGRGLSRFLTAIATVTTLLQVMVRSWNKGQLGSKKE